LQHIAQPETSEQSSQSRESLKHYGHENIPIQHIDQQHIIHVKSSPRLNSEQNDALLLVLTWISDTMRYKADHKHISAPEQLLVFIHGGPGVRKSIFAI